jgi:hypothetical protein
MCWKSVHLVVVFSLLSLLLLIKYITSVQVSDMNTQNIFKLTIEEQERLKKSFHHQTLSSTHMRHKLSEAFLAHLKNFSLIFLLMCLPHLNQCASLCGGLPIKAGVKRHFSVIMEPNQQREKKTYKFVNE